MLLLESVCTCSHGTCIHNLKWPGTANSGGDLGIPTGAVASASVNSSLPNTQAQKMSSLSGIRLQLWILGMLQALQDIQVFVLGQ